MRLKWLYERTLGPVVSWLFFQHLIVHTSNFQGVTWLGRPLWQNVLDLWNTQEVIWELRPDLIIECGTFRGGSAIFYAHLFDLMGHGRVVSIDIQSLHSMSHQRVEFLVGSSSTSEAVIRRVGEIAKSVTGPVMVILDSDHSRDHVSRELELYSPFVTPGSSLLVQDGVIDRLLVFRKGRPGPLPAIRSFLETHPEFQIDHRKCERFLITHHPSGWLRRTQT